MAAIPERVGEPGAVMLCDVNTSVGSALTRAVVAAGLSIRATTTRPSELLELTAANDPDVVVVDLALAGQAGTRLLAAIHWLVPRCPVIAAAALTGMDRRSVPDLPAVIVDPSDLRPLAAALHDIATRRTDHPS